jgi:hypothetical protein
MKKFTIWLLSAVFVALIACSIQSISADHELQMGGEGIFANKSEVNLVTTQDSDYQVYLQAVLRNGDGQLINITENLKTAAYIPHELTDHVFDTLMGEKEIITIDNIKYEKVQYTFSPTLEQRWMGIYPISEQITINIKVEGDALVQINEKIKDHALWKIHYCADFSSIGHPEGLQCIPIFQVLVPTIALEPTDIVIQQWTILRSMN